MADLTLDAAVAVLTSEVRGLRQDFKDARAETRADMKMMAESYVPRAEWQQWRASAERDVAEAKSDAETARTEAKTIAETSRAEAKTVAETARLELREEVAKIRGETEARRIPWTAVGAFVVALAGLAFTIFQPGG